jgi:hypothetical protein
LQCTTLSITNDGKQNNATLSLSGIASSVDTKGLGINAQAACATVASQQEGTLRGQPTSTFGVNTVDVTNNADISRNINSSFCV